MVKSLCAARQITTQNSFHILGIDGPLIEALDDSETCDFGVTQNGPYRQEVWIIDWDNTPVHIGDRVAPPLSEDSVDLELHLQDNCPIPNTGIIYRQPAK